MKVIQLIQKPQLRGAEVFASQLSNHLQKSGMEIHLISVFSGDAKLPYEGKASHLGRPLKKRFWDFKAWKILADVIKKENVDIIQANAGDTLKFAILSKLFYKWKTPIVFRNANKMGDFIDTKPKYLLNRFFVNRVDAVVSVSKLCREDFINTFAYPNQRICTIPIGVEKQDIPEAPPEDLRATFERYNVLVSVGSLVPEKNHKALLRIFDAVAQHNPDIFLLIIGDGRLREELEGIAASLTCKDKILFAGYRNDVLQVLQHASAFLMPSLIEGLPGVILEAMYCKTPVIANNVGGVSEVVNSDTGWLIEKGDEEGFIRAVEQVLMNSGPVQNKVMQGYKLVSNEYMNEQIAARFKGVYQNVVNG